LPLLGSLQAWAGEIWNHGYLGVDVRGVLLAAAVLAVAFLSRAAVANLLMRQVTAFFRRSGKAVDDATIEALASPLRLFPIILSVLWISEFIVTGPRMKIVAEDVLRSLVAFTLFWTLFQLVGPVFTRMTRQVDILDQDMREWAVKVARIVIFTLGAAAVLDIWGIRVGSMLAGLGLFGVAVALGAQDLFKNIIAGVFIITEQRFQKGDWIRGSGGAVEGTVEKIGLRTTRVRQFDNAPVYVPNTQLADNAVINFTQMTFRRISWTIGLEYRSSVDQLREIRDGIEAYILKSDDFVRPPESPVLVRVDSLGDSAINLMVYCFTRSTDSDTWLRIKEELAYAIKTLVARSGADFAFPSHSIYVESFPATSVAFRMEGKP